jgi:hypothetical protein
MEGNGGETAVELKGVVGGKIAKKTFESHEPNRVFVIGAARGLTSGLPFLPQILFVRLRFHPSPSSLVDNLSRPVILRCPNAHAAETPGGRVRRLCETLFLGIRMSLLRIRVSE